MGRRTSGRLKSLLRGNLMWGGCWIAKTVSYAVPREFDSRPRTQFCQGNVQQIARVSGYCSRTLPWIFRKPRCSQTGCRQDGLFPPSSSPPRLFRGFSYLILDKLIIYMVLCVKWLHARRKRNSGFLPALVKPVCVKHSENINAS